MSADAPLSISLSRLSPDRYSRLVSAYYSLSQEQRDPARWRVDNPLWSWVPGPDSGTDSGDGEFSLSLDLPPVEPEDGPAGFLRFLFGDDLPAGARILLWSFRRKAPVRSAKRSHWVRRMGGLPSLVTDSDWYFGPGLPGPNQKFTATERVKAAEVAGIPCLWADIDIAHPAHRSTRAYPPDLESAVEFLMGLPAPPTVMVDTGHGLHAYWCLSELFLFGDDVGHARGTELALRWHGMLSGLLAERGWETDNVSDLARVLRLPGTFNLKDDDDRRQVTLLSHRGRRYYLWELESIGRSAPSLEEAVAFSSDPGPGPVPDPGVVSSQGSGQGSGSAAAGPATEQGSAPASRKPGNGGSSGRPLSEELSAAAKLAIVEHYFGSYEPDGRGERRCGDIEGTASRHGASGGSFAISAEGLWRDFATDDGGDVIALIMARENIEFGKVRPWLERQGHLARRAAASGKDGGKGGGKGKGKEGSGRGRGRGRPKKEPVVDGHTRTALGLVSAFRELGFEFRYNRRAFRREICPVDEDLARWALSCWSMWQPGPDGWGEMTEFLEAALKNRMEVTCVDDSGEPLHWSDQGFTRAVSALCAEYGVDPFALWMGSLPPWDGVFRLARLFIDALGAADSEVNRTAARLFLAAAVQRTWHPGVKHDWMPVLVSAKQGTGKSTLVSLLMPSGRDKEWYSSCGRLNDTTQRILESVGGAAIVEFAELQNSYGSFSKSFLSRQTDTYRRPYARTSSEHPRPWVGIGTANDSWEGSLPDDPTGNRRFVAIDCPGIGSSSEECTRHVRTYMAENRDQLWAEAIHLARTLESFAWPGDLEKERDKVNRDFEESNEGLEGQVAGMTAIYCTEQRDGLPLIELMVDAHVSKDIPEAAKDYRGQGKFREALVKQGWVSKRVGKQRRRLWYPPDPISEP